MTYDEIDEDYYKVYDKLKNINDIELIELCEKYNLPIEGSRMVLIDRVSCYLSQPKYKWFDCIKRLKDFLYCNQWIG
jgi:hypothetical protein